MYTESENMQTSLQTKGQQLQDPAIRPHRGIPWKTHMHPLTSILIVLAAAMLWVAITSSMLALLGRAERRSGLRDPRKSAVGPKRRDGSMGPRKRKGLPRVCLTPDL